MAKAVGAWPMFWSRGQGRGGVANDVGASQGRGGVAKAVEALPRPWRRGQGRGGMAKAVVAWQMPWGRGQGLGGVAKAVRSNPNRNPKASGRS